MNWEITTFIAYFVILLGVALVFYFNGTNKNSEDFFLGGRSMGPWVTALSAQASDMSAWLLMGLPGSILAFGFGQMWIGIGLALGTALPSVRRPTGSCAPSAFAPSPRRRTIPSRSRST